MMRRLEHAVYRQAPLPEGPLKGRFFIVEDVLMATASALTTFQGPDGPHEGMVFWGGKEMGNSTLFTTAVVPCSKHRSLGVSCGEMAVRDAVHTLRGLGLGLLAQVHSHPGGDVTHSEGDDHMILLPFGGMLSIVVQHYGQIGMLPVTSCGIHQFQQGKWVRCTQNLNSITVIPKVVDLR